MRTRIMSLSSMKMAGTPSQIGGEQQLVPLVRGPSECRQHVIVQRPLPGALGNLVFHRQRGAAGRFMRDHRVGDVELVFHEELPVRALDDAIAIADRLHLADR